jgi:hypothetical protein
MSSQYVIRTRLIILFFTLLSLAVVCLNSANAHFSTILRDRARSDSTNTADSILDDNFQRLQNNILIGTVFTAVATAAFLVYGAVIAVHPTRLRDNEGSLCTFAVAQIFLAFIMIATGGYLADHVHGFYTSFEKFSAHDSIPYYSLMYYGGVAQAAYGSILVFLTITVVVFFWAFDHYENKQSRVESETAVPNTNEKEFS